MILTEQKVKESLWNALVANPNDADQLTLWVNWNQTRFGPLGGKPALQRAADLPESWLAKIWLTKPLLLEEGQLNNSMQLYKEALRLAPRKSLAVQEISGHLGEVGYFREAIELLLPIYSAEDHGPWAGFNLYNSCLDAGDLASAQEILNRMKKAHWAEVPGANTLQKIVWLRQEKLNLLCQKLESSGAEFN